MAGAGGTKLGPISNICNLPLLKDHGAAKRAEVTQKSDGFFRTSAAAAAAVGAMASMVMIGMMLWFFPMTLFMAKIELYRVMDTLVESLSMPSTSSGGSADSSSSDHGSN